MMVARPLDVRLNKPAAFYLVTGGGRQRRRKLQESSIKVEWARHLVLGHRDKNAIARIYDRPHAH